MTARSSVPFDPQLVAPWRLGTGRRGVLLLHGFAGTPPELRRLGEHLAAHGYRCHAPALAGHGLTPEDLRATTWQDWAESAREAFEELQARCDTVCVAGQSMGGTLALHLAATDLRVAAVATLAAPVWVHSAAAPFLPLLKRLVPWQYAGGDVDLWLPEAIEELYSHNRRSTRSIHEFFRLLAVVRNELVFVRAPVLVLHGGRDRVIDPRNSEEIAMRLLCSAAVERRVLARSGHGMSVDVDHDDVHELVQAWFDHHVRSPARARAGSSSGATAELLAQ